MSIGVNSQSTLEQARQLVEAAKKKAEEAKAAAEKEKLNVDEANEASKIANENVATQQGKYTQAGNKLSAKQTELNTALSSLDAANASGDENAIAEAQQNVDKIKQELAEIEQEVKKEYEELLKAQQDAQTALRKAEISTKKVEETTKELETAEAELEAAETALKEAEEAEEAKKAEEAKLEKEVSQLTEAEAIEQGYTVIKTAEDLQAVANNLSGKYILMNDIDLSGVNWVPIGKYTPTAEDPWAGAFAGEFNGNGFSVKNLTVEANETNNAAGLFGATNNAKITNTILENINVNAPSEYNEIAVGGLIGRSHDTNIDNIAVSGNITGHQAVGGLIGIIEDSEDFGKNTLSNINTNVNVNASFYAGGMIGKVESTERNSLVIENCHTSGSVTVTDSCAGGLIGEAGKTVITVNKCSSDMDIARENDYPSDLSWLLDTSRIGGIIGNCNGTYISVCNSEFTGTLEADDEFKSEVYGWYMNDAQVSIFELSAGLPADDILNIDGVDAITPIVDPQTGASHYEITVSTLAGMNRIVDMIQNNPKLAEVVTFNVQFDFEEMDEAYENSEYSQYGVVQHLYEDEEGNVVNDVYIDNEIDLETTFNVTFKTPQFMECNGKCELVEMPEKTMVAGLYKGKDGKYYIETPGATNGKYTGFTEVSLRFFFENQKTIVASRLDKDEVRLRDELVKMTYKWQANLQKTLAEKYGYSLDDLAAFKIQEPEYKALKKKEASGQTLTKEEKVKIELFELNYNIMNMVGEVTRNEGCGMGGNASFLEKNKGIPLEDEWGRIRYMNLNGLELRQKVGENGEPMVDENGAPIFETLEGELYDMRLGEPYIVRGFPVVDENDNFLYKDASGQTVTRIENEDGSFTYTYEDGSEYNDDPANLKQQLEEQSPNDMANELNKKLSDFSKSYGTETNSDAKTKEFEDDTIEEPTETDGASEVASPENDVDTNPIDSEDPEKKKEEDEV